MPCSGRLGCVRLTGSERVDHIFFCCVRSQPTTSGLPLVFASSDAVLPAHLGEVERQALLRRIVRTGADAVAAQAGVGEFILQVRFHLVLGGGGELDGHLGD